MSKDPTLWSDSGKKFKPRNKQTAMLIRPSLEIFLPPPVPVIRKSAEELHRERLADLEEKTKRIKNIQEEGEAARILGLQKSKEHRKKAMGRKLNAFKSSGNKPTRRARIPKPWLLPKPENGS